METATKNTITISYVRFRGLVDGYLNSFCGLGVDELPDFDLWDYYENDMFLTKEQWRALARDAAQDLLRDEGFDFEED
jgi:hypothetical protein